MEDIVPAIISPSPSYKKGRKPIGATVDKRERAGGVIMKYTAYRCDLVASWSPLVSVGAVHAASGPSTAIIVKPRVMDNSRCIHSLENCCPHGYIQSLYPISQRHGSTLFLVFFSFFFPWPNLN